MDDKKRYNITNVINNALKEVKEEKRKVEYALFKKLIIEYLTNLRDHPEKYINSAVREGAALACVNLLDAASGKNDRHYFNKYIAPWGSDAVVTKTVRAEVTKQNFLTQNITEFLTELGSDYTAL